MMKVTVIGDGAFGTAIALHLDKQANIEVRMWSAQSEQYERLSVDRENKKYLPGVPIPESIQLFDDPVKAVAGADLWVSVIPTVYLRSTISRFRGLEKSPAVISLTKGVEQNTFLRPSEIISEILETDRVMVLSGPTHAEEVSRGLPTSVAVAGADPILTSMAQQVFNSNRLRVYTNSDLVGVELAGALKNVIGIAAGISDGLGYGDNAKSALVTRGLVEMARFGVAHGADAATFNGLAGLGDLITTCFSQYGRNRRVGERLGRGESLQQILANTTAVCEGVTTAKSIYERSSKMGLELPIMTAVYRVLYEGLTPIEGVQQVLSRRSGSERW
ncbi:MAG: NAD(P)-dependent glycerol-3-phosphate dehydrogenase [Gemmataceae bacterium]|jgi:glycerol-3-phosphate dehydrogenase (NAD(P)+)|nr:NAD(P)-dependent glycerol-3-phosphate dehydrogenase [Gemmataceae bacterium]